MSINISNFRIRVSNLKVANTRSLEILKQKNRDSLSILGNTIGALGTSHAINSSFPIIEEFLDEGYLTKIQTETIKFQFENFNWELQRLRALDANISNQYTTSKEPFFYDKINYANVAFSVANQEGLVRGGPETNYQSFYDNMELWNLLTFKLEMINSQLRFLESFLASISTLENPISKELTGG